MRIEESDNHECEFKLIDISDSEWDGIFLEGIRSLVSEAREGKTDFIVLPYDAEEVKDLPKTTHSIEIDDGDTEALVQIGAVAMIKRGLEIDNYIDYGAGHRKVQHKIDNSKYWREEAEKWKELAEYYGRLLESE